MRHGRNLAKHANVGTVRYSVCNFVHGFKSRLHGLLVHPRGQPARTKDKPSPGEVESMMHSCKLVRTGSCVRVRCNRGQITDACPFQGTDRSLEDSTISSKAFACSPTSLPSRRLEISFTKSTPIHSSIVSAS